MRWVHAAIARDGSGLDRARLDDGFGGLTLARAIRSTTEFFAVYLAGLPALHCRRAT